jgi:hypothetical protein
VAFLSTAGRVLLERYRTAAEERRGYDRRDPEPCDLSILPRVVTAAQAAKIAPVCRRIVQASLDRILDIHAAGEPTPSGLPLAWIARHVRTLPAEFFGNVRLDFLLERGGWRLLEGGWVNLSGVDYAPQVALALVDTAPELARHFRVERPAERIRARLVEQGTRRLAILVKEEHTVYAENDWNLIREVLAPIESIVVPEPEFHRIRPAAGGVLVDGLLCDTIYLRSLDGPAAFSGRHAEINRRTLALLIESGAAFHDHPLTLLAEDKDLEWLVDRDPGLRPFVPRTCLPAGVPPSESHRWVLKLRDRHSGEGVFLEPDEAERRWNDPAAILQERVEPDRFPVVTVHGLRGDAVADLAVHVSYRYHVARRELVIAEVAGYFSRFTLVGGKVNLCTGGGIVPVFSETAGGEPG